MFYADRYNMKKIIIIFFIFSLVQTAFSMDTVYPVSANITSAYSLNAHKLTLEDTLIITRQITNNETYSLSGIYLSENLPSSFEIVDISFSINGGSISNVDTIIQTDLIYSGYQNYQWIIDYPDDAITANLLYPEQNLSVVYKIVCTELGNYQLPGHTALFYGNGQSAFSTSAELSVEVVLVLDSTETDPVLPSRFLISRAYPNPFNGQLRIDFEAAGIKMEMARLEIFDLLGRKVYSKNFIAENEINSVYWNTDNQQSTGLYFYKLTVAGGQSGGKIVLLK